MDEKKFGVGKIRWKGSQTPEQIAAKNAEAKHDREGVGPDDVVKLPSREGGYDEVVEEYIERLEAAIAEFDFTDNEIESMREAIDVGERLFLEDKKRVAKLEGILEELLQDFGPGIPTDKEKIVYYLAAAEAYRKIPSEEKRDANEIKNQPS